MKTSVIIRHCVSVGLAFSFFACMAKPPADMGDMPPEIYLEKVGFRLFRGSELRAHGNASVATYLRDTGDLTASNARMKLLRDEGDIDFSAALVTGNTHTQQALAKNGVRFVDAAQTVGVTERAYYDGPKELASGNDPVDIVGASYHVKAAGGFQLDLVNPGGLNLQGPVTTVLGETR